jgi:glycyl-tRNA synthetase beta chain
VGEFPELQGIMGGYYAASGDEAAAVSQAISDHYRPQGPSDNLPRSSEGYAVSLADKLDTLTGFFGIDQKPTGSRDPYALRRAALGILRIMDEADVALPLDKLMKHAADLYHFDDSDEDLPGFFRERLRVVLRNKGIAHDVVSAVLGCHDGIGHLHLIMRQSAQLDSFLKTVPGIGVLSGWRRVASLLAAEEKKAALPEAVPSSALFETEQEAQLMAAVNMLPEMMPDTPAGMAELMTAMAALAEPIEQFFTHVMINSEIDEIRLNRLALLRLVRSRMGLIGDLSQIEGG